MIVPHRFYMDGQSRGGDKHLYTSRTRFIPDGIINAFEVGIWPRGTRGVGSMGIRSGASVDLVARMRGKWRSTGT